MIVPWGLDGDGVAGLAVLNLALLLVDFPGNLLGNPAGDVTALFLGNLSALPLWYLNKFK